MRFLYLLKVFILVLLISGCAPSGPTKESETYVKSQQSASLDALQEAPICCQSLKEAKMTQMEYPDIVSFEINREDQAFEFSFGSNYRLYYPRLLNINLFQEEKPLIYSFENRSLVENPSIDNKKVSHQEKSSSFTTGKSFFEAFKLAPYEEPYFVMLTSYLTKGKFGVSHSSQIFLPFVVFLDEDFAEVDVRKPDYFVGYDQLVLEYTIDESSKSANYMFIFTSTEFLEKNINLKSAANTPYGYSGELMLVPSSPSFGPKGYGTNIEGKLFLKTTTADPFGDDD